MKRNMYWGFGGIVLLLGIAGVFLLIPQNIDTESELVLGEVTKKLLEDRPKQQSSMQEGGKPPSLVEHVETQSQKLAEVSINWPEGADWPVNWEELTALPLKSTISFPKKNKISHRARILRVVWTGYTTSGTSLRPK